MIFIISFIVAFLLNLYLTIFGKKDLNRLKEKISIKKYIKEIEEALHEIFGKNGTKLFKGIIVLLSITFIIFNAFTFLICLMAIILGTYTAKKAWQISIVSNFLNKIATYINRLR